MCFLFFQKTAIDSAKMQCYNLINWRKNMRITQEKHDQINLKFMSACHDGNIKQVKKLLKKGADINQVDNLKNTALHYAVLYQDIELAIILIMNGADVNKQNLKGKTPLHIAVQNEDPMLSSILLDSGADMEIKDIYDASPDLLVLDADMIDGDLLIMFLEHNVNINTKNSNGETILHRFAKSSFTKGQQIKSLVELGADVNVFDNDGYTPLHFATKMDNFEVVKALVECKADVNAVNNHLQNALFYALQNENKQLAGYLLEHGAKINVKRQPTYKTSEKSSEITKNNENCLAK